MNSKQELVRLISDEDGTSWYQGCRCKSHSENEPFIMCTRKECEVWHCFDDVINNYDLNKNEMNALADESCNIFKCILHGFNRMDVTKIRNNGIGKNGKYGEWTWQDTILNHNDNTNVLEHNELHCLLTNRNHTNISGSKRRLIPRLKDNSSVDDVIKNITNLNQNEIQSELKLRNLNCNKTKKDILISRLKIYPIPNTVQLLIDGFVRENELLLDYANYFYLVPVQIKYLMLQYFKIIKTVCYESQRHPNMILISDIYSKYKHKWRANIIELKALRKKTSHQQVYNSSICYVANRNIKIPEKVRKSINGSKLNNTYDVIFKCKVNGKLEAYLMNQCEFMEAENKNKKIINCYKWNVAIVSSSRYVMSSMCFDEEYGLVGVCPNGIYSLPFHSVSLPNQWKFTHSLNSMTWTSCTMIQINERKKSLFVVGGNYLNQQCPTYSIFDFEGEKKTCTHSGNIGLNKRKFGICYDKISQNVYIGGGNGYKIKNGVHRKMNVINAKYKVDYFNLEKLRLYKLPETTLAHKDNPILWIDDYNTNLLFIASINQNGMEYIDLRMNNKVWKVNYLPTAKQKLSIIFNTNFSVNEYSQLFIGHQ